MRLRLKTHKHYTGTQGWQRRTAAAQSLMCTHNGHVRVSHDSSDIFFMSRTHTHTHTYTHTTRTHHFLPLSQLILPTVHTHHLFTTIIVSNLFCSPGEVLPWKLATTDGPETSQLASAITHTHAQTHTHTFCPFISLQDAAYRYGTKAATDQKHTCARILLFRICQEEIHHIFERLQRNSDGKNVYEL